MKVRTESEVLSPSYSKQFLTQSKPLINSLNQDYLQNRATVDTAMLTARFNTFHNKREDQSQNTYSDNRRTSRRKFSQNQYDNQGPDINLLIKIEQLEAEMKTLINRNSELSSIIKLYQANIKRINLSLLNDIQVYEHRTQNSSMFVKRATLNDLGTSGNFTDNDTNKGSTTRNHMLGKSLGSISEENVDAYNENSMIINMNEGKKFQNTYVGQAYHQDLLKSLETVIVKLVNFISQNIVKRGQLFENSSRSPTRKNQSNYSKRSLTPRRPVEFQYQSNAFNCGETGGASGFQLILNTSNVNGKTSVLSTTNLQPCNITGASLNTYPGPLNANETGNPNYHSNSEEDDQSKRYKEKRQDQISNNNNNLKRSFSSNQNKTTNTLKHKTSKTSLMNVDDFSQANRRQANSIARSQGIAYQHHADLSSSQPPPQLKPCEPMMWIPNEKFDKCPICTRDFGIFRRKHHCRMCGILVCSGCSPDKDYVVGYKDQRVRICCNCNESKLRRIQQIGTQKIFISSNQQPEVKKHEAPKPSQFKFLNIGGANIGRIS